MNAQTKPELFAPCFPVFQIKAESIEVDADMVRFTLQYGCVEIDCEAQADELTDSTWFNKTNDPQNDVEVDYTKLEVDQNTEINVVRHDETVNAYVDRYEIEKINAAIAGGGK